MSFFQIVVEENIPHLDGRGHFVASYDLTPAQCNTVCLCPNVNKLLSQQFCMQQSTISSVHTPLFQQEYNPNVTRYQ